MKHKIIGIVICTLLISSTTTLALTSFRINKQLIKNQFVGRTPVPLLTPRGWMKTFGGDNGDNGRSVQQTSDGGYIVIGVTFSFGAGAADFWVIKTDSNGNILWNKTFGGSNWDVPEDVKQTTDNGFILTGRTHSFGVGNIDIWVIKLDETGDIVWNKTYGTQYWEGGAESQQTTDGGYIIIGSRSLTQVSSFDLVLYKIDKDGNEQWNRTFGGQAEDYGASVRQTKDGGYILTGSTSSYEPSNNNRAFWLIKTDENGIIQWNRTYGGTTSDDVATSVELTSDDGYIIIGSKGVSESSHPDIWIIKTNHYGDEQWNKTYGGAQDEYGWGGYQTRDGGYVMIGTTSSYGAGEDDVWMIKTDAYGDEVWNRTYGGNNGDGGYAVNQTSDGGYIITGYTYTTDAYAGDLWLIKTDSQGKSKTTSFNNLWFERLFERFPDMFLLFRHLMG